MTHFSPSHRHFFTADDDVFESEKRTKGLNLPSENHVREAVFTKAIETAINPLAYGANLPNVFDIQSASIVLPSKKAISKASSQKYGYDSRRTNLEKVIGEYFPFTLYHQKPLLGL